MFEILIKEYTFKFWELIGLWLFGFIFGLIPIFYNNLK